MKNFTEHSRTPATPFYRLYVRLYAIVSGMAEKASGQAKVDLESALAHILAASVASEDGDAVGIKANLSQAFALVAPHCFTLGVAA